MAQVVKVKKLKFEDEVTLGKLMAEGDDKNHRHRISDINGLQTELNGKADLRHTHAASAITGLGDEVKNAIEDHLADNLDDYFQVVDEVPLPSIQAANPKVFWFVRMVGS